MAALPRPDDLLEIRDLVIRFHTRQGIAHAVNGASLEVQAGQVVGVVGESGCGKSVMSRALLRIEAPGRIESGELRLRRQNGSPVRLDQLEPAGSRMRSIRWKEISMIFQEPMSSFGPMHTIGNQIGEALFVHGLARGSEVRDATVEALRAVGLPRPEQMADRYPHQLSGGMCQRAMIAMALSCKPSLLIADEPTTALDVSTEAQILDLLRQCQASLGMAILFISHNLAVVSQIAHEVVVMYLGKIVERAPVAKLFEEPKHPYTLALIQSMPRIDRDAGGRLQVLEGSLPEVYRLPQGCSFHPRCPQARAGLCEVVAPPVIRHADGHEVSCHLYA
jgi:oligopeptide/dipeptide ABC transporter ATP-binding protein